MPETTYSASGSAELWSSDAVQDNSGGAGDVAEIVSTDSNQPALIPAESRGDISAPIVLDTDPVRTVGVVNPVRQTAPARHDQLPTTQGLSPAVYDAMNNIQQLMMAEQWGLALDQLNAMYEERHQLNGFERSTMLMFYTNVLMHHQMFDEASIVYQEVLLIPEAHEGVRARATRALEQLDALAQQ